MRNVIILLTALFFSTTIMAQWNQNMRIGEWKISVEANQFTAKTIMELQFCNDAANGDAENIYYFKLQPHQAVTHFELMLGDTYRDGSIEERWKAVNTYNSIVGKRIDPAVLQKTYPNQYTLNVYPVAAKGCRKVRITIEEKLQIDKDVLVYSLPVVSNKEVSYFDVKFNTTNKVHAINKGVLKNKLLENNTITLTDNFKNVNDSVYVRMYLEPTSICISKKDSTYYLAYRALELPKENLIVEPKKVAVFFDVSMASTNLDLDLYFDFLHKYLTKNNITAFNAIAFNQESVFELITKTDNLKALKRRLVETKFLGASNLNILANYKNLDVMLLFSKGTSNYATVKNLQSQVPVFAIVPEQEVYAYDNLNSIVTATGGQIITIHKDRLGNALAKSAIVKQKVKTVYVNDKMVPFRIIDSTESLKEYLFITLNEPIQKIKIVQISNEKEGEQNFVLSDFCNTTNLDKIDILETYQLLEKNRNIYDYKRHYNYYDTYWARALSFGRKNKIVTEQTAYLVLERIEDYINYGITPPKEIEQKVINDPRYVQQTYRDPFKWDAANREKQNLEYAINYFNAYSNGYNLAQYKSKAQIALDKVKTEPLQIAYAGNDTRSGNSFSNFNKAELGTKLESKNFEESVVTVAYGSARKQHMVGSSAVIHAKDIKNVNTADLATAIAGRVPGLQITSESSSGFGENTLGLRIRGVSSLNGSGAPLYIIDGVAIENPIGNNIINPNEIQSITVLKDINATTLYGSRAANGAIVINSKKISSYDRTKWTTYHLYSMEDVDYLTELHNADRKEIWQTFETLKQEYGHSVNFYIDAADVFNKYHNAKDAKNILLSALEIAVNSNDNLMIAYALDEYGWHEHARMIYEKVGDAEMAHVANMYRNIAISYLLENKKQEAANAYYKAISEYSIYNAYESRYIMLEFKAMLQAYKGLIDTSAYEVVFKMVNLPVKHVTVENAYHNSYYISSTKIDRITQNTYNYGKTKVYDFSKLENKTDEIVMKCYNTNSDQVLFARVIEFNNFGLSNQEIKIKTHNCTGQYGDVIIQKIGY
jgi:TonB-dependent SusC/RagA subfamily outer membrane receptor